MADQQVASLEGAPRGAQPAPTRPVVVVSNRGPVSFRVGEAPSDGGAPDLLARRGAGGLVSGIGPVVAEAGALWIAMALGDGDRVAAERGVMDAEGFRVRILDVGADDQRMAYDVISNATLWFLHHGLWDLSRRPRFDDRWYEAWSAYQRTNRAMAEAIAADAPEGATVLCQDYHLSLVPGDLRSLRPDLATVHFSHTPFAPPDWLAVLPDPVGESLVSGLAASEACGFHTERWAASFRDCCDRVGVTPPRTFVSPLPADVAGLREVAEGPEVASELAELEAAVGDRLLITRVDRIELSKNILRGFAAFEHLLTELPHWRGKVHLGAFVYPSREGLPEYLAYRQEVESVVRRINERFGTDEWTPVLFDPSDRFPRSVAALRRADVLLVNPIRDGLNLVAKEGAVVSDRSSVVVLSREAGVRDELADAGVAAAVLEINPYDIRATAEALDTALSMGSNEREGRHRRLVEAVEQRSAADWLADQLAADTRP